MSRVWEKKFWKSRSSPLDGETNGDGFFFKCWSIANPVSFSFFSRCSPSSNCHMLSLALNHYRLIISWCPLISLRPFSRTAKGKDSFISRYSQIRAVYRRSFSSSIGPRTAASFLPEFQKIPSLLILSSLSLNLSDSESRSKEVCRQGDTQNSVRCNFIRSTIANDWGLFSRWFKVLLTCESLSEDPLWKLRDVI